MEYSIKDLFRIIIRKWYWILLAVLVLAVLAGALSQTMYKSSVRQYEQLIEETYPADTPLGTLTALVRFEATQAVDIKLLMAQDDAIRTASAFQINCTKLDDTTIQIVLEDVDQDSAQNLLEEYVHILRYYFEQIYGDKGTCQIEESEFISLAFEPTPRARVAQIVMTQLGEPPMVVRTMGKAVVYAFVLSCFAVVLVTFSKDLKQAEKGKINDK